MDLEDQVAYWTGLSDRDIETAGILLEAGRPLEALFFAHMALEKALKARIVRCTGQAPPRLHNLTRLAEAAGPGGAGMPDPRVLEIVRAYLRLLREAGIPSPRAVLFGSHARGSARPDSDIDLLVVSPAFDADRFGAEPLLWRLTRRVDSRIEPVPVGEAEFAGESRSPLVDAAKREGCLVEAA